ncbi:MAG: MazG nucleotide pyrophosphohydrolase domain-containing protein, partial [Elusimicrobiales bacterium]|nr:MazG nucleotide pyrophosphohydrolase domain-containing protein [Elusimicrobiales bacterium]
HLRSETREVERAVRARDWDNLEEELGDLLLQVVFHAALAEAKGRFSMRDVVRGINSKLVRRHPHVFGREKLRTSGEVLARWNDIKKEEKRSAAGGRRAR